MYDLVWIRLFISFLITEKFCFISNNSKQESSERDNVGNLVWEEKELKKEFISH